MIQFGVGFCLVENALHECFLAIEKSFEYAPSRGKCLNVPKTTTQISWKTFSISKNSKSYFSFLPTLQRYFSSTSTNFFFMKK